MFEKKVTFEQLPSSEASRSETKVWCGIVSKWKTDNTCCTPFESMATVETGILKAKYIAAGVYVQLIMISCEILLIFSFEARKFQAGRCLIRRHFYLLAMKSINWVTFIKLTCD